MTRWRGRMRLGPQLLVLLLAFGAIPLGTAITVGYMVSRSIITSQAERALQELGSQQAIHLSTELRRQRLILRIIVGHLGSGEAARSRAPDRLSALLAQSLPDDGVFDGLRLVTSGGRILAGVALRETAPHWPQGVPAGQWSQQPIVVHWGDQGAVAYVIGIPLSDSDGGPWLEGHVRAEDFGRLFSMPRHLMGQVESALLNETGRPILVGDAHAARDLAAAFRRAATDSVTVARLDIGGKRSLVVTTRVSGTRWIFAAALPLRSALAPLAGFRDAAVLAASILVVLIAVTAALVARSISTPLGDLADQSRRFGRGEPHQPVRPSGSMEVHQLVEAFNEMADDLKKSRREIGRLHDREMERAQQLATVGELASGIAHEVRNPLTGVQGALELALKNFMPDDPARPLLEEAQQQLHRIETTTSQLLRYARPPEIREVVVDPNGLVERAAHIVNPQATSKGAKLELKLSSMATAVRVDPELMVQVLVNLMLNALDAQEDGALVEISVTEHPLDVLIMVRDSGPGVPAKIRADVFRPFFTTKSKGTGLGLPISHQIVERHGGELRLEDTPGGGATFIVALPAVQPEEMTSG